MDNISKKQINGNGDAIARQWYGGIRERRRDRTGEIVDDPIMTPEPIPAPDERAVEEVAGVLFGSPAIDRADVKRQYVRLFLVVWNGLTPIQKEALRQVVREGAG